MILDISSGHTQEILNLLELLHQGNSFPIGPRWTADEILQEVQAGRGLGFFVSEGRELGAFVFFRDLGSVWEIVYLATHPSQSRRGLMSSLLSRLIWQMPVGGQIWLEVHVGNIPARHLYEKHGFQIVGTRERYYSDGGDAVLYSFSGS
jgi:ribosomal-protein-alanine N-acetyltransferase